MEQAQEPIRQYSSPQLKRLGHLSELTLGQGGSTFDGSSKNSASRG